MQDFRNLKVWQKAHNFTLSVYASSRSFPREELYGLTAQLRRGSVSIGANPAEGCGRKGDVEMARFSQIAMGSACEVQNYLILARDLRMLAPDRYTALWAGSEEVKRMLTALLLRLRAES